MDTILLDEESNNYTKRGHENGSKFLYRKKANREFMVNEFIKMINIYNPNPKNILDIGSGYGGTLYELHQVFPKTIFFGIDPGDESLSVARENIKGSNVKFIKGYSHKLDFDDNTFDVVNLCMVMQWVPRKYTIQTIAEIDRVLQFGGLVYLNEFLPNKPVASQSIHNEKVYIFKNDYAKLFTAFPWYREIYRFVYKIEEGEDQQRYTSILQKYNIEEAYALKSSVTDIKEGSQEDSFPQL